MSDLALRPRSATELVDAAFQLYRRDPVPFIAGMALIYVPWLVVVLVSGIAATTVGDASMLSLSPLLLLSAGGMLAYILASSVITLLARDAYFGRPLELSAALRSVVPRVWSLFVSTLILGVFVGIGFLLLIIPAVYIYARLFATKQAVLLEDKNGVAAVDRSWRLSKGSVLHVLGAMGLAFLLNFAIGMGGQLLAALLPSITFRMLISTVISVFVYPLAGIIETLLYYDIRIRREGFDIEYLASLSPLPAPAAPSTPT